MPKIQRSPEEIDAFREHIMAHALDLMVEEGYEGFSMRKLALRLHIAAKTIYNYFHSQDDLYLNLLIKGFDQLLTDFQAAVRPRKDPMAQLEALIRAYMDFGLTHANIYNLLFTWHVPKYKDYIGTPMEETAQKQLDSALKCPAFFMACLTACLSCEIKPPDDLIRLEMIRIWSQIHGYLAGINNTLLQYMHNDPVCLKEEILDRVITQAEKDLAALDARLKSLPPAPDNP